MSAGEDTIKPRRFRWKRWAIGSVLLAVAAALGAVCWSAYESVSAAVRAEMGLHATRRTILAVEDYVRKHDGKWPRSWKELEQSSPQMMREVYGYTGGPDKVEEFVSVDFNADPDRLAKQTEDEFQAIKPAGPAWESWRFTIPVLLDALRQTRGQHLKNSPDKPAAGK